MDFFLFISEHCIYELTVAVYSNGLAGRQLPTQNNLYIQVLPLSFKFLKNFVVDF
jgi:hypothetical protein